MHHIFSINAEDARLYSNHYADAIHLQTGSYKPYILSVYT